MNETFNGSMYINFFFFFSSPLSLFSFLPVMHSGEILWDKNENYEVDAILDHTVDAVSKKNFLH